MNPKTVFTLALALLLAACEPMGPMPGKSLSGDVTPPPASWDAYNQFEVIQLETSGPYSINLWGVGIGSNYYVASSRGPDSKWSAKISADPLVKLRVNGILYELKAEAVIADTEMDMVAASFKQKYDLDTGEDFPDAIVYRLVPR